MTSLAKREGFMPERRDDASAVSALLAAPCQVCQGEAGKAVDEALLAGAKRRRCHNMTSLAKREGFMPERRDDASAVFALLAAPCQVCQGEAGFLMKRGLRRMKRFAASPQSMKQRLRAMKRSLAGFMFFCLFVGSSTVCATLELELAKNRRRN